MTHITMGESEHEHSIRRARLVRSLVDEKSGLGGYVDVLAPDLLVELAQVMGWECQLSDVGFVRMRVVNLLMGTDQLGWVPIDQYEMTKAHWDKEPNSSVTVSLLSTLGTPTGGGSAPAK